MFGYVIPIQAELKVKELEQFKGAYCGLCHSLKKNYGFLARFVLNYDFAFLAILLSQGAGEMQYCKKRCLAQPFRARRCPEGSEPFHQAAGYSLILTHWRLKDQIADGGFIKSLPARFASLLLGRAYRKAARDFIAFDSHCQTQLSKLRELEQAQSGDLDRVADTFAAILPHAAEQVTDEAERRIFEQLLYHTGRWIYLIDAYDDLEQDKQSGNYNPLAARFQLTDGKLREADKDWLETTINHSANLIASAYNLLPSGQWSGILENIIYLSFPTATKSVFEGRFQRNMGRWQRRKESTDI
ncbi:MAG: DUF5685 family protein [Oscillospiraceae bacterium]|nr:DUF5685 family protein [Oscillospiraceae bacterium]